MPFARVSPIHRLNRPRTLVIVAAVVVGSVLVHLLLLGLLRWPSSAGLPMPEFITLQLRAQIELPERPSPAPRVAGADSAAEAKPAVAPVARRLPLPELPPLAVGQPGPRGSGGGGLGVDVKPSRDGRVEVGPLRIAARRVVFMVDVSSSMRGSFGDGTTLGEVAAEAVCNALEGLPASVQFRLMCFSGGLSEPLGDQWRWKGDTQLACLAMEQVAAEASGLTRSSALFDPGGLGEAGADAVVLITDGGILDMEAGALERWVDVAPTIQLDVVIIGPVATPTAAQRRLAELARGTGGGVHRLFGSTQP
jgi:hypothetical protein